MKNAKSTMAAFYKSIKDSKQLTAHTVPHNGLELSISALFSSR